MAFTISILFFICEEGYEARYSIRWTHIVPILLRLRECLYQLLS